MSEEKRTYQCWLDDGEKILSFKPVTGYEHREFRAYDEYIKFVFEVVDLQRYRVG